MKTRILRACAAIAAGCFVILGARSQTVTAPATAQPAVPVTVQPVTPPTPLLATTPAAAASTPAPYSFSMQGVTSNGANWSLPSSGALPALSMTQGVCATTPPKYCYVSIVRRPDANSTDLKGLMNNQWFFTLTVTIYGKSGEVIRTLALGEARVTSVTAIFDAQRQLEEKLDFRSVTMSWR